VRDAAGIAAVDYMIIVLYFAVMLAAAYWGFRQAKTADDYLVAGRRLGYPMFIGCMAAIVLGGASTIGTTSLGYQHGISGGWLVAMLGLGLIVLGAVLAPHLARLGIYTVPELMARRYGVQSQMISALVMTGYALMIAVTSTIAIGSVFDVVLGLDRALAILLAGGVVVVYSVAGGMWSITLTDIIQFVVKTVGVFMILLPVVVVKAGGLDGMREALPASYFDWTAIGGETIFSYFLLFFLGIMIGQDIWQRAFTGRDATVTRWGTIIAGVYCLFYAFAVGLVGAAAKVLLPRLDSPDNAFAAIVTTVMPTGLAGLVLAAALAAVMSVASAALLAGSTVVANDLYPRVREVRRPVVVSRVCTLIVGAAVLASALVLNNVVGALTVAYDLLTGALFVPIMAAILWRRPPPIAAVASMAVSSVVIVVLMVTRGLYSNDPIIFGLLTSLVVFVGVTLLTPRRDHTEAFEHRSLHVPAEN
jgi:SSS family solute:Na+ symporter